MKKRTFTITRELLPSLKAILKTMLTLLRLPELNPARREWRGKREKKKNK